MKLYLTIVCTFFLVAVEIGASPFWHTIAKRSKSPDPIRRMKREVKEETLDDPNNCIKTCTKNFPGTPNETYYDNAFVQLCFIHKYGKDCLGKCPDSKSKTLLSDTFEPLDDICSMSNADIVSGSECVYDNVEEIVEKCANKCRSEEIWDVVPEVFPDFAMEGEDPTEADERKPKNAVVLVSEKDQGVVNKNLTILCRQESCMINCQRDPVKTKCSQATADAYLRGYSAWVKSLSKIYVDLKIITAASDDCSKVPEK